MFSRTAESLSRKIAWALFASAIAAFFMLSAPALLRLGIPYDAPFGPVVAKLHPGTYLLLLAWMVALCSHGNPIGVLLEQFRREPLLSFYFGCMVLVFVWVIYQQGSSGAAYIIDTLWMPAVCTFTLRLLAPARGRQVVALILAMLALNSVVALGEYFVKARLVPYPLVDLDVEYFRSSAFLGHPLLNASITVSLLPAITLLRIGRAWRAAFVLLSMAAVLSYGARTALVFGGGIYGACGLFYVVRMALAGRYSYRQLTGGFLAFALAAVALSVLVGATGLGDRIFQNLVWDSSASVRARVWDAFSYLQGNDWWFGASPSGIASISLKIGLDPTYEAIENFWIAAFLQFGFIGYVPFIAGLCCLMVFLWKNATPPMRVAVVLYFLVSSTANSLTSKTVSLTLLAVVVAASRSCRGRRSATRTVDSAGRLRLRMPSFRSAR